MEVGQHLDAVQDLAIVLLKGRVSAIQTVQPVFDSLIRTEAATIRHHSMCKQGDIQSTWLQHVHPASALCPAGQAACALCKLL